MRLRADLTLLAFLLLAMGAGCASPPTEPPEARTTHIGVTPAYADQAYAELEGFASHDPSRELTLQVLPLEAGLEAARAGEITFLITAADPPDGWFATPLERSAVLIVAASNPGLSGLTLRELREIFIGQKTNWSQLGGPEWPIQPMIYPEGDELRTAFEAIVLQSDRLTPNARLLPDPASMAKAVAGTPGAIGILPGTTPTTGLTVLSLDGHRANAANLANGSYPLALSWVATAPQEPEGLAREWLGWVQEKE
ncbi:MAG: substrate-binding domain-containing protein [Anaerolineales bacterium]